MLANIPKMFTLTPQEASMWQMAINVQVGLIQYIFSGIVFKSLAFLFFGISAYKTWTQYAQSGCSHSEQLVNKFGKHIACLTVGFMFLFTANSNPVNIVDYDNNQWPGQQLPFGISEYDQENLATYKKVANHGLFWYTWIHKAFVDLSKFSTSVVGKIFGDNSYLKSPELIYKISAAIASTRLDDPSITSKIDYLAENCSDTISSGVMGNRSSFFDWFRKDDDICRVKYDELRSSLNSWARRSKPAYLKIGFLNPDNNPFLRNYMDKSFLENMLIATSVMDYGRSKTNGNTHNLNKNELILDNTDYFWANFQKTLSTEGVISLTNIFSAGKTNIEAEMSKNNAAYVYNRLLNFLPWFRGVIKVLLAIGFIFASAALSLGIVKPIMWWFSVLFLESVYGPISAFVYHMSAYFLRFSSNMDHLIAIRHDPLMLIAAKEIEASAVYLHSVYFIVQMVVIFSFGYGIMASGWAVQKTEYNANFSMYGGIQKIKNMARLAGKM